MTALSAIIPTRDRPDLLDGCLQTLAAQDCPPGLIEVVVVDDGSDCDLDVVVRRWSPRMPGPLRYLRQAPSGLNVGRNHGATEARSGVLAFLDDDTFVAPGWARSVAEAFDTWDCDGLAGRIVLRFEAEVPAWFRPEFRAHLSELDLGQQARWLAPSESPWGANCAVSRAAYDRVGGFAAGLDREGASLVSNGDTEFFGRVRAGGGRLAYAPGAMVEHRVPAERLTKQWFLRRAHGQGLSDAFIRRPRGPAERAAQLCRELVRAGRVAPILAKGLGQGTGTLSAQMWLAYCRGRLEGIVANSPAHARGAGPRP